MTTPLDPLAPTDDEGRRALESSRRLAALLARGDRFEVRLGAGDGPGEAVARPAPVARLLNDILAERARGHAVAVLPTHAELTTPQAADRLHVARPYPIRLLEAGAFPPRTVGTHRPVELRDLAAYGARAEAGRRAALDELAEPGQGIGEAKIGGATGVPRGLHGMSRLSTTS